MSCGAVLPGTPFECQRVHGDDDGIHVVTVAWPDGTTAEVEWWDVVAEWWDVVAARRGRAIPRATDEPVAAWCRWCERDTVAVFGQCSRCAQSI